jgi:hypothetical protein
MGVEASIHQLAQPQTASPFLVACDTGPDEYIQVGTTTLANGTCVCVFITAVPNTKLCAWGEEDSGGHVL